MLQFDRIIMGKKARELGFVRDTFEKVCRLVDVLNFIQKDGLLSKSLVLKGGTAINYTISSLTKYSMKYKDYLAQPYVIHERDYKEENGIIYLPLYMTLLL